MAKGVKVALGFLLTGLVLIIVAVALGIDPLRTEILTPKYTEATMKIGELKEVDLDFDYSDLELEVSDGEQNVLEYPDYEKEDLKLEIKEENGKLSIKQRPRRVKISLAVHSGPKVKLKLKKGAKLDNLVIKSDFSHVKTSDLVVKKGEIKMNVGAYESKGDKFTDVIISTDMGAISFYNTYLKNVNVETNMGQIDGSIVPEENLEFRSNMGEIKLITMENANYSYILNSDLGDVSFNGEKVEKNRAYRSEFDKTRIKAVTDVGQIEITEK